MQTCLPKAQPQRSKCGPLRHFMRPSGRVCLWLCAEYMLQHSCGGLEPPERDSIPVAQRSNSAQSRKHRHTDKIKLKVDVLSASFRSVFANNSVSPQIMLRQCVYVHLPEGQVCLKTDNSESCSQPSEWFVCNTTTLKCSLPVWAAMNEELFFKKRKSKKKAMGGW